MESISGKFFVKTFGCQMNVSDSERMVALLSESGMTPAESAPEADVVLINGCSVREKAVHKAVSYLGIWNEAKEMAIHAGVMKRQIIGVGGCVGSLNQETLFKQAPFLDFVFGPDTIDQLPELVYRVKTGERRILQAEFDPTLSYSTRTKVVGRKAQAFVNIMKGCDKYCSYCIVPFTRGREKSRTIDEVLDDVASLVAQGVREITLLGQNVNSFGKGNANRLQRTPLELNSPIGKVGPRAGDENFPQLLRAMNQDPRLESIKRIRFTSSHPLDFSDELVNCYAPSSQGGIRGLAPQLHLPVQSGSDRILQKMGRHHTIETYVSQMTRLRTLNSGIGLSTDLIVGFPTETEEDFQATLRLLDQVQYDTIYAFAYSPRPGTRAAKFTDDVPKDVKNRRLNELLQYQQEISRKRLAALVGTETEVLVEGEAKNSKLLVDIPEAERSLYKVWTGYSPEGRVVNFTAEARRHLIGQFVTVRITDASALSLMGEVVMNPLMAEDLGLSLENSKVYSGPISSEVVG